MANLQLNIDVNDEEFKELCSKNISELPSEKLEDILVKAVEVALIRDKTNPNYDIDNSLLVHKAEYYGTYHTSFRYEPTKLMREVMDKVDLSKYIDDLAETIREYIENNYQEMIKTYIVEKFAKMLFTEDKALCLRQEVIADVNKVLRDE